MDQDTTTRPGNGPLALGDPTPHCGAIDDHGDDPGIFVCTAAAGHVGDHVAYDSDGESCGTWAAERPVPSDQAITTPAAPFAAVLAGATRSQLDALYARFRVAGEDLSELRYGTTVSRDHEDQAAWDEMWKEIATLEQDLFDARDIVREREVSATVIAAARRANRLDAIAKAEQLLAAERTAASAA